MRFIKCSCGRTHGINERSPASRDATAEFRINALSAALREAIDAATVGPIDPGVLDRCKAALQACGGRPKSTQNDDMVLAVDGLEAVCRAHHEVRAQQGFTTAPWTRLKDASREQYREAMRAALSTLGVRVQRDPPINYRPERPSSLELDYAEEARKRGGW